MQAVAFRAAAYFYHQSGWAAMPLANDTQGFPKRPIVDGWQNLTNEPDNWERDFRFLPWERATGLGLVLGSGSHNLAVLDVDDVEMGALAIELCSKTRRIQTIRKRAHIYFTEATPSASRRLTVHWHGRDVTVELKTTGTQVAAPPTPGYEHRCDRETMPTEVPSISRAWNALAAQLEVSMGQSHASAPVWQPTVRRDNRNNTIYREAHRLREAGVELDSAARMLQARWEHDYEHGDQSWSEIEATIRSAYHKHVVEDVVHGRDAYNLWAGRNATDGDGAGQ